MRLDCGRVKVQKLRESIGNCDAARLRNWSIWSIELLFGGKGISHSMQ